MTGWGCLFALIALAVVGILSFAWGVQWARDDQARIDEELLQPPAGWLPLHVTPPGDPRRREAMRQHPAGGRQ